MVDPTSREEMEHRRRFKEIMEYDHKFPTPASDILRDVQSDAHRRPNECPCGNPECGLLEEGYAPKR